VLLPGLKDPLNVLQVLFTTLVEDEDFIQIYNATELIMDNKISSIGLIKIEGEFFNSKGRTNHSKRPSLDLKADFHTSARSIGTW